MNKSEKERIRKLKELGCVACYIQFGEWGTPSDAHHLTETGRRVGHDATIPLCKDHHKGATSKNIKISIHHNTAKFEEAYGTQEELLELVNKMIE